MGAQLPFPDQLLVQQTGIRQHAHGHRPVHRRLKLQQQHQIEPPPVVEANPPHRVAVALPQVAADEAGRQRRQRGEVEAAAPAAGGEAAQQVADHAGPGEQLLVGRVVHDRAPHNIREQASRRRPAPGREQQAAAASPPDEAVSGCSGARLQRGLAPRLRESEECLGNGEHVGGKPAVTSVGGGRPNLRRSVCSRSMAEEFALATSTPSAPARRTVKTPVVVLEPRVGIGAAAGPRRRQEEGAIARGRRPRAVRRSGCRCRAARRSTLCSPRNGRRDLRGGAGFRACNAGRP